MSKSTFIVGGYDLTDNRKIILKDIKRLSPAVIQKWSGNKCPGQIQLFNDAGTKHLFFGYIYAVLSFWSDNESSKYQDSIHETKDKVEEAYKTFVTDFNCRNLIYVPFTFITFNEFSSN